MGNDDFMLMHGYYLYLSLSSVDSRNCFSTNALAH